MKMHHDEAMLRRAKLYMQLLKEIEHEQATRTHELMNQLVPEYTAQ